MKGIELSRAFYEQFGKPMLEKDFADILPLIAVGFTGSGSERFGFDDEISKDHDYEVGFSVFLPDESLIDSRREFALERAYAKLPKEFEGIKRQTVSPVGGNRNGPIRTSDFYLNHIGVKDGNLTVNEWLSVPDYALFESTNGEVFYDGLGEFSKIRERLKEMPNDIRKKRIAGNLLIMSQSGQYNYLRCISHGEKEGAVLSIHEFVNATVKTLFLLNGKYAPFYKWQFKALRTFADKYVVDKLSYLLLAENSPETEKEKYDVIEEISAYVIDVLAEKCLTKASCGDLEKHAYSVNDGINDGSIRNANILVSV